MNTENTILVLAARGFEEIELTAPVDILRRLGVEVCLVGVNSEIVTGAHGVGLATDKLLAEVVGHAWRGIVIPGGPAAWALRENAEVLELVRAVHEVGGLVAAICAAPMVLAAAGVLRGRGVTCYPAAEVEHSVEQAGAQIQRVPAVRDGNVITGRGPAAALAFGYALAEYLVGAERTAQLKREMCFEC